MEGCLLSCVESLEFSFFFLRAFLDVGIMSHLLCDGYAFPLNFVSPILSTFVFLGLRIVSFDAFALLLIPIPPLSFRFSIGSPGRYYCYI